jgi:hypothetical protein
MGKPPNEPIVQKSQNLAIQPQTQKIRVAGNLKIDIKHCLLPSSLAPRFLIRYCLIL